MRVKYSSSGWMIQFSRVEVNNFQIQIKKIKKSADAAVKGSKMQKKSSSVTFVLCSIVLNAGISRGPTQTTKQTWRSKNSRRRTAETRPSKSTARTWRATFARCAIANSSSKISCRIRTCKLRHKPISFWVLKVSTLKWRPRQLSSEKFVRSMTKRGNCMPLTIKRSNWWKTRGAKKFVNWRRGTRMSRPRIWSRWIGRS